MRFMGYTAGIMITVPLILHCDMTTLLGVEGRKPVMGNRFPANTMHKLNIGLMLTHCTRLDPIFRQRQMFVEILDLLVNLYLQASPVWGWGSPRKRHKLSPCWSNVGLPSVTQAQHKKSALGQCMVFVEKCFSPMLHLPLTPIGHTILISIKLSAHTSSSTKKGKIRINSHVYK